MQLLFKLNWTFFLSFKLSLSEGVSGRKTTTSQELCVGLKTFPQSLMKGSANLSLDI